MRFLFRMHYRTSIYVLGGRNSYFKIFTYNFNLPFYFRFGEVQEVVDAVLYLLSDKASMISGTCLPIDGGFLAS